MPTTKDHSRTPRGHGRHLPTPRPSFSSRVLRCRRGRQPVAGSTARHRPQQLRLEDPDLGRGHLHRRGPTRKPVRPALRGTTHRHRTTRVDVHALRAPVVAPTRGFACGCCGIAAASGKTTCVATRERHELRPIMRWCSIRASAVGIIRRSLPDLFPEAARSWSWVPRFRS